MCVCLLFQYLSVPIGEQEMIVHTECVCELIFVY